MFTIIGAMKNSEPILFALTHLEVLNLETSWDWVLVLDHSRTVKPQGYHRQCTHKKITFLGGDDAGLMYGLLDLAQELEQGKALSDIGDTQVTPRISNRGIKFNIPLDARTPSYSDASDSARQNIKHMWEWDFWESFIDTMALSRYNVLSLWTLSPFPSLVQMPEYPDLSLEDVKASTRPAKAALTGHNMYTKAMASRLITLKKMTIEEKIEFWQRVMTYASKRCIRIYLITWNVFTYGIESNTYGITEDQNNPATRAYYRAGVKALMTTYPLLAGIGVTAGENMKQNVSDIEFMADTYGSAIKTYMKANPKRDFEFIHRMHYAHYEAIKASFQDLPCTFSLCFKYAQAHMYAGTKPTFIDGFLKDKSPGLPMWLTLRNDDFYMHRWGDPEFARNYFDQMPASDLNGFFFGADGFTWGIDYSLQVGNDHPLFMDKMWYMFAIWGPLGYNKNLSDDFFIARLQHRFKGISMGTEVFKAWQVASRLIPIVNQIHWHHFDFQWYPEGCCMYDIDTDQLFFADLYEFMSCVSMPGGDYTGVSDSLDSNKRTPLDGVAELRKQVQQVYALVEVIKASGETHHELQETLEDMMSLCRLGTYYALKIEAAVMMVRFRDYQVLADQDLAVHLLEQALGHWRLYSNGLVQRYRPQVLTRLCHYLDVTRFDALVELDIELAKEG